MFKKANPLFMICESSMHAGTGDNLGIVDLPIQREKHTGIPKIESSSLKGSIRHAINSTISNDNLEQKKNIHRIFGYDDSEKDPKVNKAFQDKEDFASAIGFSDARLLLFPVKSMKGLFAWITCPDVLNKFFNDMQLCDVDLDIEIPDFNAIQNTIPQNSDLTVEDGSIILEEFNISVNPRPFTDKFASWLADHIVPDNEIYNFVKSKIKSNLVILDNDRFKDFAKMSTKVVTRTKIDNERGAVEQGALFTEELLPQESIMYSLLLFNPLMGENKGDFEGNSEEVVGKISDYIGENMPEIMQIGGDKTLGRGIVRTNILE